MRTTLVVLLCFAIPATLLATEPATYKVKYRGGSLSTIKSGMPLIMTIDATTVKLMQDKTELAGIPGTSISEVSYGRDVHRRVGTAIGLALVTPFAIGALAAFSKSKKHHVGIIWETDGKKGGLALQCDKNDYRGVLAALEAVSGKKAVKPDAMSVK